MQGLCGELKMASNMLIFFSIETLPLCYEYRVIWEMLWSLDWMLLCWLRDLKQLRPSTSFLTRHCPGTLGCHMGRSALLTTMLEWGRPWAATVYHSPRRMQASSHFRLDSWIMPSRMLLMAPQEPNAITIWTGDSRCQAQAQFSTQNI